MNKRFTERVAIAKEVSINNLISGIALDISPEGMYINVATDFKKGTRVTVTLNVNGRPVNIKAVVRHVTEASIGVEFQDLTESTSDLLNDFIDQSKERREEIEKRQGQPVILMIDDVPASITPFKRQLILAGYRIIEASNGIEAIKELKEASKDGSKTRIELVITDLLMSGMDGFKIITFMQQDQRLSRIPIVVLSAAHRGDEDIIETCNLGIARFFMKHNTNPVEFAAEIKRILQSKKG